MKFSLLVCLLLSFFSFTTYAEDQKIEAKTEGEEIPSYIPRVREEFPTNEKLLNFGVVYAAQWAYYLVLQRETIDKEGSFHNWTHFPFSPHFDKDSFDYNLFKHTLTGQYYYLWFRSRGYTETSAFMWTFISSLAFEFTVETITERPSYQDIYQTPVFGTVAGIGVEKLSRYFHGRDTWWGHTLGYLLNPFTLIPTSKEQEVTATPIFNRNQFGAVATYRF